MKTLIIVFTIFSLAGTTALVNAQQADPFAGPPPICPRWAFEPWVWEDVKNTQTSTQQLVQDYLDRNIPVGAIIVDSPWETHYNTFVWDSTRYPNPQQMIDEFRAKGVRIIVWITGFINIDAPDFQYAIDHHYTVDDSTVFRWWKGKGVHLDFTNDSAKKWWHGKMDRLLSMGISGWKVDMSADKVADTVSTSIGRIPRQEFKKYYYADFYDYTVAKNPNAIIVARAYSFQGGIGAPISKSPINWQGDFRGDFPGLNKQKNDVYESALRGYAAPGVEVGGYGGGQSKSSLIRYAQFGALTPLMENGGAGGGLTGHLPWYWDEETVDIYRYYATLHSELVPYIFSYSVEAHLTGKSILRYVDKNNHQHTLGDEIFVSIFTSDDSIKLVTFPSTGKWIDYWNESVVYKANATVNYFAPLHKFPIFIKAGAIIPMNVTNAVTHHGDETSAGRTTIFIYPSGTSHFTFHKPQGDGTEYSDVSISVDEKRGTIDIQGTTVADYRLFVKDFYAPDFVSGADNWGYDSDSKYVIIDRTGASFNIQIHRLDAYGNIEGFDQQRYSIISQLTVYDEKNSDDWSIQKDIQPLTQQYGDRSYRIRKIPPYLIGSEWIRTANDSKNWTSDTLAIFTIEEDAHIFIAHRDDIPTKPAWLTGWTDTGDNIINDEKTPRIYSLYKKDFPAGSQVLLGPNGSDNNQGMYTVIVKGTTNRTGKPKPIFHFAQNYPNPFNAATTIRFTLYQSSKISLEIYNTLGQRVETLIDGFCHYGAYKVEWRPRELSAGIYLCRLKAAGQIETRKLIYQK